MPCCSKKPKKTKEELEQEQYEKDLLKVYNKDQIYIDADGNFRYGEKQNDPEYELSVIVDKDDQVEEEGKIWYVISTGWMNAWLLYTHLNRGVNPKPGRVDNESLLDPNADGTGFVPKGGLEMARKKHEGDYRRISEAAWLAFCDFYPGSGPAIKTEFIPDDDHSKDGLYDCSCWQIDQSMFDELMGNVPKQGFKIKFNPFKKKDKDKDKDPKSDEVQRGESVTEGVELMQPTGGGDMKEFFGDSAVKNSDNDSHNKQMEERNAEESSSWLFED